MFIEKCLSNLFVSDSKKVCFRVNNLKNDEKVFTKYFWVDCKTTVCVCAWRDIVLFANFENGHIAVAQIYF